LLCSCAIASFLPAGCRQHAKHKRKARKGRDVVLNVPDPFGRTGVRTGANAAQRQARSFFVRAARGKEVGPEDSVPPSDGLWARSTQLTHSPLPRFEFAASRKICYCCSES